MTTSYQEKIDENTLKTEAFFSEGLDEVSSFFAMGGKTSVSRQNYFVNCKNCVFHVDKKIKTLNVFASYYEYVAGKGIHLNNERLY